MAGYPIYTGRHSQHSAVWTVPGVTMPTLCIACATERLENEHELVVHVSKILEEFAAGINCSSHQSPFLKMLTSDWRITEHICNTLLGDLNSKKLNDFMYDCCHLLIVIIDSLSLCLSLSLQGCCQDLNLL